MLVFFPPLRLAVLAAYAVAVSTAPSTSTDPGLTNVPNLGDPGPSADLTPGDPVDVALACKGWSLSFGRTSSHTVPAADSFIQSGGGDHSIKPANHSTYVDADDTPEDLNATVEGIANIKLSGPLAAPRHIHDKRGGPTFRGCTPVEVNDILAAIYTGWKDARRAASGTDKLKMNDNNSNEWATKYRRWFGPIIEARRGTVEDMLLYIESKVRFRNWPFLCRTGERAAYPAKICNYTLEPWDCYSVTDAYLDQSTTPEKS